MGRVYASSDWHGCGYLAEKVISYLQPDDKLYFLGDSIDRGDDGIGLFNFLTKDPRVTYLRGNHEELMYKTILESLDYIYSDTFSLWLYGNGGNKTWSDIELLDKEELLKYANEIKAMPLKATYRSPKGHTVILEHAGFTPNSVSLSHDPLWDRDHFHDKWGKNSEFENTYIVHGHTPVQYLKFEFGYIDQPPITKEEISLKDSWDDLPTDVEWKPEVIRYCDGHKFDIDMCTVASGRVALLDLDTFEIKYFDE